MKPKTGSKAEPKSPKNKDWETASFAALMFSIREYKDRLSETRGIKLNSKSREIDVRIIDKHAPTATSKQSERAGSAESGDETGGRINNAIAYFFERHNLIELKNPRENLNIDVFWKGISYAAQYKSRGYDDTTNEYGVNIRQMSDITLTFLRVTKPERLLSYLSAHGYTISQQFSGVYYISGIAELKIQIVVGCELEGDEFIPLRVQKENASEEDIRKFIEMCGGLTEQADKDMAENVMQVSIANNQETYRKIVEETKMSKALEVLMADKLAAREEVGRTQGRSEGRSEGIAIGEKKGRTQGRKEGRAELLTRLQESGMITADQAATAMGWSF